MSAIDCTYNYMKSFTKYVLACPKKHEVEEFNVLSSQMIENHVRNNSLIHKNFRKNCLPRSLGIFLKKVSFFDNFTKSAQKKWKILKFQIAYTIK